jgi:hypothetical protein
MNFLIVAIDHGMQQIPSEHDTPDLIEQKTRAENKLSSAIVASGAHLVCEESDPTRLSIAQKMCYEREPRIPWKNIVMTAQERLEAGIWEALLNRPIEVILCNDGNGFNIEHRIPEDDIRERFFVDEVIQRAVELGATNLLVICGDMHVDALKKHLEDNGYHADVDRELIPVQRWK